MPSQIQIQQALQQAFPTALVNVNSKDGVHYTAEIIAVEFENLNLVKRQQAVYKVLNEWIATGALHAIALKTWTPTEFKSKG
jgi:acid stress-induced BolA-like protein IbaG/YrbA